MYFWSISKGLGLFPYPVASYDNSVRMFLAIAPFYGSLCVAYMRSSGLYDLMERVRTYLQPLWELALVFLHYQVLTRGRGRLRRLVTATTALGLSDSNAPVLLYLFPKCLRIYLEYASNYWEPQGMKYDLGTVPLTLFSFMDAYVYVQYLFFLEPLARGVEQLLPHPKHRPEELISRAMEFSEVCGLARDLSWLYGRQLALLFAKTLYLGVCAGYTFVRDPPDWPRQYLVKLWFLGYMLVPPFVVCHRSRRLTSKADEFNDRLFKIMKGRPELRKEKQLQLFIASKRTIKLSAGGFFTLDMAAFMSLVVVLIDYIFTFNQFAKRVTSVGQRKVNNTDLFLSPSERKKLNLTKH